MWIYSRYGFYSVARDAFVDPNKLAIRARDKGHLEALMPKLREMILREMDVRMTVPAIIETHDSDYQFRILLDVTTCRRLINWLVQDIDYDNFKQAALMTRPRGKWVTMLHDIWSTTWEYLKDTTVPRDWMMDRLFNEEVDGDGQT